MKTNVKNSSLEALIDSERGIRRTAANVHLMATLDRFLHLLCGTAPQVMGGHCGENLCQYQPR